MKYQNKDFVTSIYVQFEPVSNTVLGDLKDAIMSFLEDQGLDLEHYEVGFLIDNKTKDMNL